MQRWSCEPTELCNCVTGTLQELTLILLTWRIGWATKNANRRQTGFNLSFKGLKCIFI